MVIVSYFIFSRCHLYLFIAILFHFRKHILPTTSQPQRGGHIYNNEAPPPPSEVQRTDHIVPQSPKGEA